MFSLVKYLYYGSEKKEQIQQENKVQDTEPEIINSYNKKIEEIKPVSSYVKPPVINTRIESIPGSSFVNAKIYNGSLTETIMEKLRNDTLKADSVNGQCTNKPFPVKNSVVYLVVKKTTGEPLGIYNSLATAKIYGQKSTYHNCSIYEFKVNDPCKYLMNPVFENN